jgi:hypothetical protein
LESVTGQKIKISKEEGSGKQLIQEIKSKSDDVTDANIIKVLDPLVV